MEEALMIFAHVHMVSSFPNFGKLLDRLAETGQNLANAHHDNDKDMIHTYESIQFIIQNQLCSRDRVLRMDYASAKENPAEDE
jgi:hypothetical protein